MAAHALTSYLSSNFSSTNNSTDFLRKLFSLNSGDGCLPNSLSLFEFHHLTEEIAEALLEKLNEHSSVHEKTNSRLKSLAWVNG